MQRGSSCRRRPNSKIEINPITSLAREHLGLQPGPSHRFTEEEPR